MVGAPQLPLRGRDRPLETIRRLLHGVREGVGAVILVEGRAGAGKSRLLQACISMAGDMSFRTGFGVAEPGRNLVEVEPLLDALFNGAQPLIDRNSLSDVHASPELRFWLLQDLESLIEKAALKDPLLICLDDLHWAGTGFADAMRTLPQRLASVPVAWIMAFRPDQPRNTWSKPAQRWCGSIPSRPMRCLRSPRTSSKRNRTRSSFRRLK